MICNDKIEALLSVIKYWKELKNLYTSEVIVGSYDEETNEWYILEWLNKKINDTEQEVALLIKEKEKKNNEL